MQYIQFGNSGMEVSRFCLGAMAFSQQMDEKDSGKVVDEAIENGVNFIDTAESYGDSEEFLGRILEGKRQNLYLATKVHRKRAKDGKAARNSRGNIIHSLERSLKKLKTDYVDLYMLHHPDPDTPLHETMSTLENLVQQGKVRYVGVSNHYAWQMAYMIGQANQQGWEPILSVECRYNIFDRVIENETLHFCQRFNIATMTYGPLCGGILSGKYKRGQKLPEDSRAAKTKALGSLLDDPHTFDILDELEKIAADNSVNLPQLALMWTLGKSSITTPILGGSKPKHFSIMYEIADKRLSEQDMQRIDELSNEFKFQRFSNQARYQGAALAEQW